MIRKALFAATVAGAVLAGAGTVSALGGPQPSPVPPQQFDIVETTRSSVATDGTQRTSQSSGASISGNARLVVFTSAAAFVPEDTNGVSDVYLRNRRTNTTQLVSLADNEAIGNDASSEGHISAGGRFVVYTSRASNLTSGVSTNELQVYVRDLEGASTIRASIAMNNAAPNGQSRAHDVSDDGRFVSFRSDASNLTTDDNNPASDHFVRDTVSNTTTRLDRQTTGSALGRTDLTPDGHFVVYTSQAVENGLDANTVADVYRRDLQAGTTALVSRGHTAAGNGRSDDPQVSDDGRVIVFRSCASNLVEGDTNGHCDILVRNMSSLDFIQITSGNADSEAPEISGDGRVVAFDSGATDLVANDTNGAFDVFSRLVTNGNIVLNSVRTNGERGNRSSLLPALSASGNAIAWESVATNLVTGDTNNVSDVFTNAIPA